MAAFGKSWCGGNRSRLARGCGLRTCWMMEQLRKILWISAFVCLVMTGFGSYVWSASQHSQDVVKIETKKEPDRTAESKGQGNRRTKPTESPLRLVQASQTEKADNIAPHNPAKDAEEASEYWTIVGSKLKVTDTLLAIFTFLLIPVGAFQAIFLWRTVVHMRISERAHVSGGANHVRRRDNGKGLIVTINNYGKTPANIGTVAATIWEKAELKTFPGWKIKAWPGHEFSANGRVMSLGKSPDN
jgi:hypothetical protein